MVLKPTSADFEGKDIRPYVSKTNLVTCRSRAKFEKDVNEEITSELNAPMVRSRGAEVLRLHRTRQLREHSG